MIPWWVIVAPTLALAGWAYLYGQAKERARCIGLAVDEMGRGQLASQVDTSKRIAAAMAKEVTR